jgi:hypothetical protein
MTDTSGKHGGLIGSIANMFAFAWHQFRMWFLPLHGAADDDLEEQEAPPAKFSGGQKSRASWWDDDDEDDDLEYSRKKTRRAPEKLEFVEDDGPMTDGESEPLPMPTKFVPIIREPEGGENRMARNALLPEGEGSPESSAEDGASTMPEEPAQDDHQESAQSTPA